MRWSSRLLLLLAGLAALGALGWAFWPAPVAVETAQVTRGRFEETIVEDGKTRVRERYIVAAPLAGTLLRFALRDGDPVAQGEILTSILPNRVALLDPRARQEAEQRLGAAEASLARARALTGRAERVAEQARLDAERTRVLVARGTAPRTRLEHDTLALQTAVRDLEAARSLQDAAAHEVALSRAALAPESEARDSPTPWPVRAPVAGQVLRVLQKSEGPVASGAPLLEIGDPADLEVIADVLTTDAVRIRKGDPVRIEGWGGDRPLRGVVRLVEPGAFTKVSALGVDEQRTNVVIDVTTPLAERAALGDAYRVEVRIVVAALDDTLIVPTGALFRDRAGWAVFVIADGRARRRAVVLAYRGTSEAAVTKGLAANAQVILFPGDTLADGVRVRPR